jgi:exodeoxyribonuclease-3
MAEERDWISELLDSGFVDAYRHLHPDQTGAYTWWSPRGEARAHNQGWRMDYLFLSADLTPGLLAASLHPQISGSDHCPASILLEL